MKVGPCIGFILLLVPFGVHAGAISGNSLLDDPGFNANPDVLNVGTQNEWRYNTGAAQVQWQTDQDNAGGIDGSFSASVNLLDDIAVTGDVNYDVNSTRLTGISTDWGRADFAYAGTATYSSNHVIEGYYTISLQTTGSNYHGTSHIANIHDGPTRLALGNGGNNELEDNVIAAWNVITWDTDPFAGDGIVYADITGIDVTFYAETLTENIGSGSHSEYFSMNSVSIQYEATTVYTPPAYDLETGLQLTNGAASDLIQLPSESNALFGAASVSYMEINKSGMARSADKLKTDASLICNGTLHVVLLPGSDPLEAGDAFDLFDGNINGAITGTFDAVNLPVLASGLEWTTNTLYTQGFIWVRETNAASPATKPNVIILFADDLGYADAGFQPLGASDIITPHIDSLAENGVAFSAGYACGPVCSPSRGGLMTGQYQNRFALHDTPATWHMEDPATGEIMHDGIPPGMTCFGHRMQDLGYVTGMIGKWHGGETREHYPPHRGFDEFFGFNNGATSYYPGENDNENLNRRLMRGMFPVEREDEYITDAFGREAVSFINRHADNPFFLYVPFNAPHGPMTASDEHSQILFGKNANDLTTREKLISMVYSMDLAVGDIIDAVNTNGLAEETLIVFFSDNGGTGRSGGNASDNVPLRGVKGELWDGGIRVPFCMQWKGQLPEGLTYDFVVSGLDLLPTSVEMAGGTFSTNDVIDGNNILPAVRGDTAVPPNDIVLWWHNDKWVARDNEWKLIDLDKNGTTPPELYRIIDDISETSNVYADHPDVAARLYEHYTNTVAEFDLVTDASRWSSNSTYYLNITDPAQQVIFEPTNVFQWLEAEYPGEDMDGDGISNADEFLLGLPLSEPSDLTNGLRWDLSGSVSNGFEVAFRKRVDPIGENNIPVPVYRIEYAESLLDVWGPANAVLVDGPDPSGLSNYVDEVHGVMVDPAKTNGFYRLVIGE